MNKDWEALSMHWEAKARQLEAQLAELKREATEAHKWHGLTLEAGRELEAQLKTANETIADLRDYNNRAPKLAAEECNKQKAELEARLAEVEIQRNYEVSWKEANAAQAEKLTETVETLSARLVEWDQFTREKDETIHQLRRKIDELESDQAKQLQTNEYLLSRCDEAEARAKKAEAANEELRPALEAIHKRARLGGGEAGLAGEQYALVDIFTLAHDALCPDEQLAESEGHNG